MKILHTSDIHLDSPLSGLPEEKSRLRQRELLEGFHSLIETAKSNLCSSVIISGDLFDTENVSKRAIDTALLEISSNPGISFFYLPGNHENQALISSGKAMPKNLFIFGEDWSYFRAGDLVIAGRSSIAKGMFDTLRLSPDDKNLLVLHGEPTAKTEDGLGIGLSEAAAKPIDYLALGHYHSHKSYRLGTRGYAVYSGAPFGRGFDECGEKGAVLIDSDRLPEFRFIPLDQRQIRSISLDITGIGAYSELICECKRVLSDIGKDDIVRLELTGKRCAELWIDGEEIESAFSDRFFHFELKNSSRLSIGKGDYRYDKTLKGEFVRLVMAKEDLEEETKEKIISLGLYALLGE